MSAGEPRLVDTGRGLTLRYRGRYLYSSRDPLAAPRRQAAEAALDPGTLVYVPCLGLGYGLTEVLERLPERSHVLCIEADHALMALAAASGVALPRSDRLTVVRLDAPERAAVVLRSLGLWRFRRLLRLPLCRGSELHTQTYRRIQDALEEEIRLFWQNKITLVDMSRLWLKNLFTNLTLLPDAPSLDAVRVSAPVLVTGAGPSLESSLPEIRRIRERIHLMASDTSLPALAASGFLPDSVCVLEAQLHNLGDFVPAFDPSLPLLCDLTSSPTVLHRFPNRVFFSSRFSPLRLFGRLERCGLLPTPLPPLGSVGVSAVQLALRMTRAPVLLAGLDFAYRPGQTHARGTAPHVAGLIHGGRLHPAGMESHEALAHRPLLRLSGRGGEAVTSDLVLHSYSLQLRRLIEPTGRVFDLGGEGLPCGALPLETPDAVDALLGGSGLGAGASEWASAHRVATAEQVQAFCRREADLLGVAERHLLELVGASPPAQAASGRAPEVARGTEVPDWLEEVGYLLLPLAEPDPARILSPAALRGLLAGARYFRALLRRLSSPVPG
jgi:hypothetical protein